VASRAVDDFGWDVPDDNPLPFSFRDLEDACRRAAEYRKQQPGSWEVSYRVQADVRADAGGWVQVGVITDMGVDLRAYWHPETDRVRVERPPAPKTIDLPRPKAPEPPPGVFQVRLKQAENDDARVRFVPLTANLPKHTISMTIRTPQDESLADHWWWATRIISVYGAEISVPHDFPTRSADERKAILGASFLELVRRIGNGGARR